MSFSYVMAGPHSVVYSVKSLVVEKGRLSAVLEASSNSPQTLRLAGENYENLQRDSAKPSFFQIPVKLNSTIHFSVKERSTTGDADAADAAVDGAAANADAAADAGAGATAAAGADVDAVSYEVTLSANESALTPDSPRKETSGSSKGRGNGSSGEPTSSGDEPQGGGGEEAGVPVANAGEDTTGTSGGTGAGAGATNAGNAGNLSALVQGAGSTVPRSTSPSSPSSSSASSSSSSSRAIDTTNYASRTAENSPRTNDARVSEVNAAASPANAVTANADTLSSAEELVPFVAGGAILLVAIGAITSTLLFYKRESPAGYKS